jgi:hypothetical protein
MVSILDEQWPLVQAVRPLQERLRQAAEVEKLVDLLFATVDAMAECYEKHRQADSYSWRWREPETFLGEYVCVNGVHRNGRWEIFVGFRLRSFLEDNKLHLLESPIVEMLRRRLRAEAMKVVKEEPEQADGTLGSVGIFGEIFSTHNGVYRLEETLEFCVQKQVSV